MKWILSIIIMLPIILLFIILDLIKLPLVVFIVAPFILLISIADGLRGDSNWFDSWIDFNLDFGCFTYLMRDELFGF